MTTLNKSIEFLRPFLDVKKSSKQKTRPLFIGLEGPQGSGKTTLSKQLDAKLSQLYPCLSFLTFSMDDFYLTFEEQNLLIASNQDNPLLNGRGLPGTHDVDLLIECLERLSTQKTGVDIPVYDKSKYSGHGDRLPFEQWIHIKGPQLVDVVIFEGWFNGYLVYPNTRNLLKKWSQVKTEYSPAFDRVKKEHVLKLNGDLAKYQSVWNYFDAFICITTDSIENVYRWRLQQEHDMIKQKGSGMTDKQVACFVDRYMPGYRLYFDNLTEIMAKIPSLEVKIALDRTPIAVRFCYI
ncbi:hypothetical protein FOA43_002215 [Brettanomyces nanus]|uniref:Uncharacterized protein n=1 Tax=Eeniella nana TaxID=13502 RepID=A0A875S1Q6_EENNA|nr:uncharacterized protein FOA43_002215 [Brettanomyces nanus]QPG74878.1 hypothetical protein FOA43_002215 [Brettanomyces nanus]